jgi:hypothetical protein
MDNTEKLIAENEHYKQLFGTGDLATKAYAAVARIMKQQVEVMESFDLKTSIKEENSKDKPMYGRVIEMYEKMPKMISELHRLKNELGIEYVEKETKTVATTPQSMAKLLQ